MRNILVIALLLNLTLKPMDRNNEQSSRGRAKERITHIDPEFAEYFEVPTQPFEYTRFQHPSQQPPKKHKKINMGCFPSFHLARVFAAMFRHYLVK